jgi:hypothetical protein
MDRALRESYFNVGVEDGTSPFALLPTKMLAKATTADAPPALRAGAELKLNDEISSVVTVKLLLLAFG